MCVQAGGGEGVEGGGETKKFLEGPTKHPMTGLGVPCGEYHRAAPSLIRLPWNRDEEC